MVDILSTIEKIENIANSDEDPKVIYDAVFFIWNKTLKPQLLLRELLLVGEQSFEKKRIAQRVAIIVGLKRRELKNGLVFYIEEDSNGNKKYVAHN